MRRRLVFIVFTLLVLAEVAHGDTPPPGFRWLSAREIQREKQLQPYLAEGKSIIRVGVLNGDFLVFEKQLQDDPPANLRDSDREPYMVWNVYTLHAGRSTLLVSGFHAEMHGWKPFVRPGVNDLIFTYYSCNECEPALVMTAFHHSGEGWIALWSQKPAVLSYDDIDFNEYEPPLDQMVALLPGPDGTLAVAAWAHTGKNDKGARFLMTSGNIVSVLTRKHIPRHCMENGQIA